jgi:hypothetical protein
MLSKEVKADAKFVNQLLLIAFSINELEVSSITGQSKSGNQLKKLDPGKLESIRGNKHFRDSLHTVFYFFFFAYTVLFISRFVGADDAQQRADAFHRIINRKIQNIRVAKVLKMKAACGILSRPSKIKSEKN